MIEIQVWFENHWKDGIRRYDTVEDAKRRLIRLHEVGITARIKPLNGDAEA